MTTITYSDIDQALESLLNSLSPAQLRSAMREIASYLRKHNAFRIRSQQNPDGSAYTPRKDKTVRRKMLTGFTKHLKQNVSMETLEVGIFGHAANLAHIHHDGQAEDGIQYPSRKLIGFSDEDKYAIRDILLKFIAGQG